jgi:uncharacterized membrane protein HdeD (DUF308 family)
MMPSWLGDELEAASDHWGLLAAVGILLIVCGVVAIFTPFVASGAAILLIGFLLVAGGVAAIIGGIRARAEGGLAFYLVSGILAMIAGIVILRNPAESLGVITLLIAVWLIVDGIFRIVAAFMGRTGSKGWAIFGGILAILLGVMVWAGWPVSALWFLGLAVGIEMIFLGFSWLSIGMAARAVREQAA